MCHPLAGRQTRHRFSATCSVAFNRPVEDDQFEAPPKLVAALKQLQPRRVFVPPLVDDAILKAARHHLTKPESTRFQTLRRWLLWPGSAAGCLLLLTALAWTITKQVWTPHDQPIGEAKIVGIEGGAHPAFAEPPFYDPKAMQHERVIIAAFNTAPAEKLPKSKNHAPTQANATGTASLSPADPLHRVRRVDGWLRVRWPCPVPRAASQGLRGSNKAAIQKCCETICCSSTIGLFFPSLFSFRCDRLSGQVRPGFFERSCVERPCAHHVCGRIPSYQSG